MGVEFVDYTLLKKRGLIKIRNDSDTNQQRFNFGQDGFVDLGNLSQNNGSSVPVLTQAAPQAPEQATVATPQMAAVPDFLSVLAQANTSSPSLETPREPVSYSANGMESKLDDLSRTIQILVDRISELDIKVSKLSGNFK